MISSVKSEPITATHLNAIGCKMGLPITGTFELTARCNFNCRMCYVHLKTDIAELKKRELTAEQWLEIARKAREKGLIFLLLTGGEPFLREDFPYLYEQLIKMGFVVSINSNASLYNDTLSNLFKKYPPSRINVTLYGGSEETYSGLCGNPSFEKVISNLKRMKSDGLQVRLNVSLTPYNVNDMQRIDSISRELNLQAKASAYMYPPARVDGSVGENSARFTPEEAGKAIAEWYSIREDKATFAQRANALKQGIRCEAEDNCVDPESDCVQCRAGRSSFWITWDGKMTPCGTMSVEGTDVVECGFEKAWNDTLLRTTEIRLPLECAVCSIREHCGVCASICKCESGEFNIKPTYVCAMTEAKIQEIFRIAGLMGEDNEN